MFSVFFSSLPEWEGCQEKGRSAKWRKLGHYLLKQSKCTVLKPKMAKTSNVFVLNAFSTRKINEIIKKNSFCN